MRVRIVDPSNNNSVSLSTDLDELKDTLQQSLGVLEDVKVSGQVHTISLGTLNTTLEEVKTLLTPPPCL